ncbi:hypothetical protein CEP54_016241, partial [Fusarium duplospermum]
MSQSSTPSSISTVINIYNLCLIRLDQGQLETAHDVWTSILRKMETVLGERHECTVLCKR